MDRQTGGTGLELGVASDEANWGLGEARLPTEERVEHVLMAVTLAAAGRLGAVHHRLKPASHIHLQHLVTSDETVLL